MGPDRFELPKIAFIEATASGMTVSYAYLVRIKGVPWAYANRQETHLPPEKANAFRLDPSRIVEETNTETGQTEFAYRGSP
jgi:hypothetical protein